MHCCIGKGEFYSIRRMDTVFLPMKVETYFLFKTSMEVDVTTSSGNSKALMIKSHSIHVLCSSFLCLFSFMPLICLQVGEGTCYLHGSDLQHHGGD